MRDRFEKYWPQFLESDPDNSRVMGRDGDQLWYMFEELVPEFKSGKPQAILLFGNPAPHSVNHSTFFAYEGNGSEHRVWKVMRDVGLLEFEGERSGDEWQTCAVHNGGEVQI